MSSNPPLRNHAAAPIAVIGLAALMPKSNSLSDYWTNILNETDCLERVPSSRWPLAEYFDADPAAPDRTYSDRGGFVPDLAFDPLLFGLPPKTLSSTDASQLYALAVGRQALLDAGYNPDPTGPGRKLPNSRSGIVLGVSGTTMKLTLEMAKRSEIPKWIDTLRQAGVDDGLIDSVARAMRSHYPSWTEDTFPGFLANVVAGRVANRFGLGAASHTVDAACASSLAAVRLACQELRSGAADIMVTGGVDTDNSNVAFLSFSKTPALSKTGKVRSFDAGADGTMISEGVGMLVLKRLEDAEADGDRIYGVIRGLGASTDAAGGAIYAPRSEGQVRALHAAYADAGFDPRTVGLIEAHATGTVVGDAVEIESLEAVLGEAPAPIALGSVKAQIGHTKAAAGAASLIKIMLALYHKVIPATLNVQAPNARLKPDGGPFYLPRRAKPWLAPADGPRRAGVSVFGFGGANLHVAVEEYQGGHPAPSHHAAAPILLHADTPAELAQRCRELAGRLRAGDHSATLWPDAPPPAAAARVGLLARSLDAAPELLDSAADMLDKRPEQDAWSLPAGVHYRRQALAGEVVAVFSGQGSQTVGMGARLLIDQPQARQYFEAFDDAGRARGFTPVSRLIFAPDTFSAERAGDQRTALTHTLYAQTAIGAYSMAAYSVLRDAGLQPRMALGHSFGELSALWAAGVFDDAGYRAAVLSRGDALTPPAGADAGGMIAIQASAEQLQALAAQLPGLHLANHNSPKQTVAGGDAAALERAIAELARHGIQATRIAVAAAFHTGHVGYAAAPWQAALRDIPLRAPAMPVLANLNAQPYPADSEGIRALLAQQPFNAVRFQQQIEAAYQAGGRIFVEIGPRAILTRMVDDILGDRAHIALPVAHDPAGDDGRQIQEAILRLAVLGQAMRLASPVPRKPAASPLSIQVGAHIIRTANQPAWPVVDKTAAPAAPQPAAVSEPASDSAQLLAQVHQNFLEQQAELARILAERQPAPEVLAEIRRAQDKVHALHQAFLDSQRPAAAAATPVEQQALVQPAPAPAPTPAPAAVGAPSAAISQLLLATVADKTGYPVDMLSLDMRLEADLGVDSIKRVEILSSVRDALGVASASASDELRSAATLAEIAALLGGYAGQAAAPVPAPASAPAQPVQAQPAQTQPAQVQPVQAPAPTAAATPSADISQLLLATVADKTGYPVDMLSLDMRLEADLGVDSIKRVEILSSVRDALGVASASASDELRSAATLAEIAALLGGYAGQAAAPAPVIAPVQTQAVQAQPAPAPSAAPAADVSQLLLATVADKTGYPVDMLSLDMRLEADLGVDSIKRVEILSSVRDALGVASASASDELRSAATLAEIAALLGGYAGQAAAPAPVIVPAQAQPAPSAAATPAADVSQLLLATVADKTGYPVDMLSLDMRLEADLGVDSIKRVEILSSVRDALGVASASASDELRSAATLAEIAALLGGYAAPAQAPAIAPAQTVQAQPAQSPAPVATRAPAIDISQLLLATVADKTGYPVDMLSLDMRLEADLGVDSIKRVEILSSVRDALGVASASASDELRSAATLAEIAALLGSHASDAVAAPAPAPAAATQAQASPWQALPVVAVPLAPPQPRGDSHAGKVVLVIGDGGELAAETVDQLARAGYRPVALHWNGWMRAGAPVRPASQAPVVEAGPQQLADALEAIETANGAPAAIVLLQPQDQRQASRQRLGQALLAARQLLPWLNRRSALLAVARLDGRLGTAGAADGDPVSGGLAGLIKTLRHEVPGVAARFVDLAPRLPTALAAERLLQELADAAPETAETGWDEQGRWTLDCAAPGAEAAYAGAELPPLRAGELVLVTGGARGVTAHCVQALARQVPAHFVLIGRSALLESDPAWAAGVDDNAALKSQALQHLRAAGQNPTPRQLEDSCRAVLAAREVRATLRSLAASGAQATYLPLDLGDVAATRAAIGELTARLGRVAALVHGAGALADRRIADKTAADIETVFRPKLDGFLTLLEALRDAPPARIALFSSTAGYSGNFGQSDYAMANEALSKLAFHLPRQTGGRVVSLAWGPWEGGMVTPALRQMFAERGVGLLPVADGAAVFSAALTGKHAGGFQFVVGDVMPADSSTTDQQADDGRRAPAYPA
ncbi:type I polyketide synthase [Chromobacterium sp. ATCC 53434]|uniref:type I polyketide synthase n=1 Tax=Chromobacterium sp. (strain ATCC 53434 / SC 14030) TaxID=2059672 RepID=UPI0013053EC2|nr:type I polyketide synthase [Chromobacterium sp. ATCC 53434]